MATAYGVEPKRPWRTAVRFWTKVEVGGDDECWLWTGTKKNKGYGVIEITDSDGKGRKVRVHRIAYRSHVGPIPHGVDLHHRCQTRLCCNPSHLELLDHVEHGRLHGLSG
jgi:hypothetical protein